MKNIAWIHLSDLNIGSNDEGLNEQSVMIDSLISDIKEQIQKHDLKINFIFVSGDLFYRGCRTEWAAAEKILTMIADIAMIDVRDIFIVPGNHDITRDGENVQTFTSFVNDFCHEELYRSNELFYEVKRNVFGKTISIIGLNTALPASIGEGSAFLSEYQVRKSLQAAENSDIIISLMHHPLSLLNEEENAEAKELLSKRADFILTGHIHNVSDVGRLSIYGNAFCVTSGTIYDQSYKYGNSYNITVCDLKSGTGKIYFRQFTGNQDRYWNADDRIDESISDGIVSFQIPSRIQIEDIDVQRFFEPTLPAQAAEKKYIGEFPVPKIPRALIEDIRRGDCYLFEGAGASVDAGLPGWFELLHNGIDALNERVTLTEAEETELRELLFNREFLVVADYLRYRLGERWFGEYIKKHLSTAGRRSLTQEILSEIPFKIVMTTNYDDFIERYRAESKLLLPADLTREGYDCVTRILDNGNVPVIKLHGTYDRVDSMVFGDAEYSKLLYNSDNYRKTVERLLSEKSCVFIGSGFSDINILAFLQSIHEKKGNNAPRHYAIMKSIGIVMERYFRERLNIEPVFVEDFAQVNLILYQIKDSL